MACNPYAISDDEKKVQFGYWVSLNATVYNKDGGLIETLKNLKYTQGPFNPTKESLLPQKPPEMGTYIPKKTEKPKSVSQHNFVKSKQKVAPLLDLQNSIKQSMGSKPIQRMNNQEKNNAMLLFQIKVKEQMQQYREEIKEMKGFFS